MEISHFEDIQAEFMGRLQQTVYCNVATVDRKGRPRSMEPSNISISDYCNLHRGG
jgi:hypothetical protein